MEPDRRVEPLAESVNAARDTVEAAGKCLAEDLDLASNCFYCCLVLAGQAPLRRAQLMLKSLAEHSLRRAQLMLKSLAEHSLRRAQLMLKSLAKHSLGCAELALDRFGQGALELIKLRLHLDGPVVRHITSSSAVRSCEGDAGTKLVKCLRLSAEPLDARANCAYDPSSRAINFRRAGPGATEVADRFMVKVTAETSTLPTLQNATKSIDRRGLHGFGQNVAHSRTSLLESWSESLRAKDIDLPVDVMSGRVVMDSRP